MSIPLDIVDQIQHTYALDVFIETGTYLGFTVEHMLSRFKRVYSIELGQELADLAKQKFAQHDHVWVIQGDSGVELHKILQAEDRRALIWLDAHWSGGTTVSLPNTYTPVAAELNALNTGRRRDHVIMVDDIYEFTGDNGYPTLDVLIDRVKAVNPNYTVSVDMRVRRGILVAAPPVKT